MKKINDKWIVKKKVPFDKKMDDVDKKVQKIIKRKK